jgi:DNA-binding MarR family transcriptional regulator
MNRKRVIKRERSPACMNIGERERFIQVTKKEEKMSAWHKNYNF